MARIVTSRKSGFIMRDGRMRRQTLWFTSASINTTLSAASTASIVISLNAAALALRPFTIVRNRGYFSIRSDNFAVSTSETYEAAVGQIVVKDEAVAIGVTAVPTPIAQDASDWHVYARLIGRTQISADGVAESNVIHQMEIDSKAMRKVDLGEDMIEVVETSPLSLGLVTVHYFRTLIKLH